MDLFPHSKNHVYLNHASMSPYSTQVKLAIENFVKERHIENIENYFQFQHIIEDTYKKIASLLHTDESNISLTANTTTGINILASSFKWKKGDRILLNNQEFPANVYPFLNCKHKGVEVDFIGNRDEILNLAQIEQALTPQTKILSISMVQFLSGQAIDLKKVSKLCHDNGTFLCVDAIQGLGATDLNVEECYIDFLACGSHKWLMAPEGLGFIFITDELKSQLVPSYAGWLSVENQWELLDYNLTFLSSAKQFQTGMMNHIAIAGLHASLSIFMDEGYEIIRSKVLSNSLYFMERFPNLNWITPVKERLGIVTFVNQNAEKIYLELSQKNITVSVREKKFIRISPHYYHQREELDYAALNLERVLENLD